MDVKTRALWVWSYGNAYGGPALAWPRDGEELFLLGFRCGGSEGKGDVGMDSVTGSVQAMTF